MREKAEATYGGGCTRGLSDSDFTGQVEAEVNYEVSAVPPDVAGQYLDALARLWKLKWGPAERSRDRVDVQIDEGKFRLYGVYSSGSRRVDVGGTSGCTWVNGTPGPMPGSGRSGRTRMRIGVLEAGMTAEALAAGWVPAVPGVAVNRSRPGDASPGCRTRR